MAFYTGYFDESGHETQQFLVFGGLVLDSEDTQIFDDAWKHAISPLESLHIRKFATGKEGVEGKVELLTRAADVIAGHSFRTFASALSMQDYHSMEEGRKFSEFFGYPFSICARFSDIQLRQWAKMNGVQDRIRLVLEWRTEGTGDVADVFNRDALPIPSRAGKKLCPLQAADFIAWMHYGKLIGSDNYNRLKAAMAPIPASLHTYDFINYSAMSMCGNFERINGQPILSRESEGVVAFHHRPKQNRTRFGM